jgi:hypothetical protein
MLPHRDRWVRLWVVMASLALLVGAGLFANGTSVGAATDYGQASQSTNSSYQPAQKESSKGTTPFDCSRIQRLGLDKQMNFHASEIVASCLERVMNSTIKN